MVPHKLPPCEPDGRGQIQSVTITITPLLSLEESDQVSQIVTLPKDKVNIAAYHVDELSNEEAKQLTENILKMPQNTGWNHLSCLC